MEAGEKLEQKTVVDDQTCRQKVEEPASQKLTQTTETGTEPDENENIQNEGDTGDQSAEKPAAKGNSDMQRGVSHVSTQTRYGHRSKATQTTNETYNKSKMSCKFFCACAPSLFLSTEVSVSESQNLLTAINLGKFTGWFL